MKNPFIQWATKWNRPFRWKRFGKNWGLSSRLVFPGKIRKLLNHLLLLFPSSLMKYAVAAGGKWNGSALRIGKSFKAQTSHFVCWKILQFKMVKNSHTLFSAYMESAQCLARFNRSIKLGFRLHQCSSWTHWTIFWTFQTPLLKTPWDGIMTENKEAFY